MPNSVLEAIRAGNWNYEPEPTERGEYRATQALPGSGEKLEVLALRAQQGLPLWHPDDRHTFNDAAEE